MATPGLTFVLDQNLSTYVLAMLRNTRVEPTGRITSLSELGFAGDAPDTQWLVELGQRGHHCVVTRDGAILQAAVERAVWSSAGVSLAVLAGRWGSLPRQEIGRRLLYWWPHLVRHVEAGRPGAAWTVSPEVPSPPARGIRLVRGPGA